MKNTTAPFVANAAFSAVTGMILTFGGGDLADRLGIPPWFGATLGLGLVGFAVAIAWVIRTGRQHLAVVVADVSWVVIAAVVLIALPGALTDLGRTALAVVTVFVAVVAWVQWQTVRRDVTR